MDEPIMTFRSQIGGKDSDVAIHADRIEWVRPTAAGMIDMHSVRSVTTARAGARFAHVYVSTPGGTVGFSVWRGQANGIRQTIMHLMDRLEATHAGRG